MLCILWTPSVHKCCHCNLFIQEGNENNQLEFEALRDECDELRQECEELRLESQPKRGELSVVKVTQHEMLHEF
jgi:hypothetical protein